MYYVKFAAKVIAFLSVLILMVFVGAGYYIDSHKDAVINDLKSWFDQHHNGTLNFSDISVSTFKHFPAIAIKINDVKLVDTLSKKHQVEAISAEELYVTTSLKGIFQKEILFTGLHLKNGYLKLQTNEKKNTNTRLFLKEKKSIKKGNWFTKENTKLTIENFHYSIINTPNNQQISGTVKSLDAVVKLNDTIISGRINLQATMKEMGFNLNNGVFLENTAIVLQMDPIVYLNRNEVTVPTFTLKLNEQNFDVSASIDTKGFGSFNFLIENPSTNYTNTVKLLPLNIQKNLTRFRFTNPLKTATRLIGSFGPNSNPLVDIRYSTAKNTLTVSDSIAIKNLDMQGTFISEENGNLTLKNDHLQGNYIHIPFVFHKANLFSDTTGLTTIDAMVNAKGKTKNLNKLFNNNTFIFEKGAFDLTSHLNGNIANIDSLLATTTSELALNKSLVTHKALGLQIPIDSLNLKVKHANADLDVLQVSIEEDTFDISGTITNATSLIFGTNQPVTTQVNLQSKSINWESIEDLLKPVQAVKKDSLLKSDTNKLEVNDFAKSIYKKFNPKLAITVDEFKYKDFKLQKVTSNLYFKNENELIVKNTGFSYREGDVVFDATLDIFKKYTTAFIIEFTTSKLNFAELIQDYNYFGLSSLQHTKQITGNITLDADLKGTIDNNTGLQTNTLNGKMDFDIADVSVSGFEPIEKVADLVFRKSRFEDIRFAPITNSIFLKNETVEIPRMELQSTAFNLYVQGHLGYHNNTNIWVSIPLNNLKYRAIKDIPNKVSYIDAGKKVYIQVVDNKDHKLDYKFHLTNKKLFEEEGKLGQYKKEHKQERVLYRAYRKKERKKLRLARIKSRKQRRLQKQ